MCECWLCPRPLLVFLYNSHGFPGCQHYAQLHRREGRINFYVPGFKDVDCTAKLLLWPQNLSGQSQKSMRLRCSNSFFYLRTPYTLYKLRTPVWFCLWVISTDIYHSKNWNWKVFNIYLLKGIISPLNANMNNMIHEKSLHFTKQKNSVRMTLFSIKKIPQCFA